MEGGEQLEGGSRKLEGGYHVPVLLKEAVEGLAIRKDGIYVDCTFGGGGHSREILTHLGPQGKLIAFDQDEAAKRNLPDDTRIVFVPFNFRHLSRMLRFHGVAQVDGILADLGVSSHQFDQADRGFSTRFDAELDMRMDQRQALTAAKMIREMSEDELVHILSAYGEVTNAKTLARTIITYRESVPLQTIQQFKEAVGAVVRGNPHKYFAQVFQALRIAVNDELGALREMLEQTTAVLKPGGRLAVITFHSIEDRIVKTYMKQGSFEEEEVDEIYGTKRRSPFRLVTKKPILPSPEELKRNPRSRSAKLRVAELA